MERWSLMFMLALVEQIVLPLDARRCTRRLAPRRAEKGEREIHNLCPFSGGVGMKAMMVG